MCGEPEPTQEEAKGEEDGGQPQHRSTETAVTVPRDRGRVGFVKAIPHLGAGRRGPLGLAPLLRPHCGPEASSRYCREDPLPNPASGFSALKVFLAYSQPIPAREKQ